MKTLGIDTSTPSLGIALVENGKPLAGIDKVLGLRHSQDLVPGIKALLEERSLSVHDIDCFAVSRGPGSFTGLRVGIAAAKTLAMVTKKAVIGVPTLDVIAHNAYYYPGIICPVMDAKKRKLYAAFYLRGARGLRRLSPYLLLSVDELTRRIDKKTLIIGDGITLYGDAIKKQRPRKVEFAPSHLWLPKAVHVALLGEKGLQRAKKDNPLDLVPLYLHSRECSIQK